jgi:hypothetical protein
MKRGSFQISFGWLFAIIVGGIILFFAFLFATRIINIEEKVQTSETSKEIGILLNPLESGFESSKTTSFAISKETRIYNKCSKEGFFGSQLIRTSQKNFNKWSESDVDVSFQNKYIFSEEEIEGKKFYVFSKPFDFPFKIAELIYLTSASEKYCFVSPPSDIKEELKQLGQGNVLLENCSEDDTRVCFSSGTQCDIIVNYNAKYVRKQKKELGFEGDALMYAAVFSDPDIYECQVERLMKRAEQLALLYTEKERIISMKGCESALYDDLMLFSNSAGAFNDLDSLSELKIKADFLETKNDFAGCRLW